MISIFTSRSRAQRVDATALCAPRENTPDRHSLKLSTSDCVRRYAAGNARDLAGPRNQPLPISRKISIFKPLFLRAAVICAASPFCLALPQFMCAMQIASAHWRGF